MDILTIEIVPPRDENDQPRRAIYEAFKIMRDRGDTDNALSLAMTLLQRGSRDGEWLTDDMALAIYG